MQVDRRMTVRLSTISKVEVGEDGITAQFLQPSEQPFIIGNDCMLG